VQALVRSDRLLTVRMIASELHFKLPMFHQKFKQKLAMRKCCVQIVAKRLTIERRTIRRICIFIFCNGSQVTEISLRT